MSETVEKNNRFYKQPNGEVLTENEQLKEWLKIANESNDYFREENVRLINREKELLREIHNKINENERLNNKLKDIKSQLDYLETFSSEEDVFEDMKRRLNRIESIVNRK